MIRLLQHGALVMAFLGVALVQKVDLEWKVQSHSPSSQCTKIVFLPQGSRGTPLPKREAWLPKSVEPHTQPRSPIEGAEAEFYVVTGYAIGDRYTPGEVTADGRKVRPGITAACRLPLGTMVYIEGIGPRVCEDRGTGPPGVENWIDVAFETAEEANDHGAQWLAVVVIR